MKSRKISQGGTMWRGHPVLIHFLLEQTERVLRRLNRALFVREPFSRAGGV
jgi:hypothetical protein